MTMNGMEIFVSLGGRSLVVQVDDIETGESLRQRLALMSGIPPDQQVLLFGGKSVEGGRRLCDLGLGPHSVLSLNPPLLGGAAIDPINGFYFGHIPEDLIDHGFCFDFRGLDMKQDKKTARTRGGKVYLRPCGYARLALKVSQNPHIHIFPHFQRSWEPRIMLRREEC